MALKLQPLRMDYGIEFNDLYFKVTLVSYNDELKELSFAGACYVNKEASKDGKTKPIEGLRISGNFPYDNKEGNWFEDVYNYIKGKAASMKGKTTEQIQAENDEEYVKAMKVYGVPENIQDPTYLNFVDAEDCQR